MANALAKTFADDIAAWVKGTAFPAVKTTFFVALLTTNPTKNDGTGLVECSDAGYARQSITNATGWGATATDADNIHEDIANVNAVTFPAASAGYTVVGVAIYDALTAGTLWMYQQVTSQAVASGNQYQIAAGALKLEF